MSTKNDRLSNTVKHGYEATVKARALMRVGGKQGRKATLKALGTAALVLCAGMAWGSPWSLVVKSVGKSAGKSAVETGGKKAVATAATHTGAKLALAASPAFVAVQAERANAKTAGKAIAQVATPKNILAAGVATAAVVGSHEVADGVQAMGESAGHAMEQHPELVPQVVDTVSSTAKWLAVPGGILLVAILAWILWPFVRLLRASMALYSARRIRRIEQAAKAGYVNWYLLVVIALVAVLAVLYVWRMTSSRNRGKTPARIEVRAKPRVQEDEQASRRAAELARLRNEYEDEVLRAHRAFQASVEGVSRECFAVVRSYIPVVAERFGTFSRCADLVKTMVVDKIKGEDTTSDFVKQDLEQDFYAALYASRDAVGEHVTKYRESLESARVRYCVALENLGVEDGFADDADYNAVLSEASAKIEVAKAELREGQISAAVSVVVEVVLIRETVAAIAKALGKIAAREAAAITAGAGAAVADGPLPIGDIIGGAIAIGGTAWTAWDVYSATKILPEQMALALDEAVTVSQRQCREDAEAAGEKLLRAYLHTAH